VPDLQDGGGARALRSRKVPVGERGAVEEDRRRPRQAHGQGARRATSACPFAPTPTRSADTNHHRTNRSRSRSTSSRAGRRPPRPRVRRLLFRRAIGAMGRPGRRASTELEPLAHDFAEAPFGLQLDLPGGSPFGDGGRGGPLGGNLAGEAVGPLGACNGTGWRRRGDGLRRLEVALVGAANPERRRVRRVQRAPRNAHDLVAFAAAASHGRLKLRLAQFDLRRTRLRVDEPPDRCSRAAGAPRTSAPRSRRRGSTARALRRSREDLGWRSRKAVTVCAAYRQNRHHVWGSSRCEGPGVFGSEAVRLRCRSARLLRCAADRSSSSWSMRNAGAT